MLKKKKIFYLVLVVVILVTVAVLVNIATPKNIYSMEKKISKALNTRDQIEVLNLIEIYDYRFTGYFLREKQLYKKFSFALFRVDRNGDYELIKLIDADEAYDLAPEITGHRFSNLEASNVKVEPQLVIISNNIDLTKIEQINENGEINTKEIETNPSISIFSDYNVHSKANYKFYYNK